MAPYRKIRCRRCGTAYIKNGNAPIKNCATCKTDEEFEQEEVLQEPIAISKWKKVWYNIMTE